MARDWTLTSNDKQLLARFATRYRLFNAIQLCAVRVYGRFIGNVHEVTPRVLNYLAQQLELPVSLTVSVPERKKTAAEHRSTILTSLGFRRFDASAKTELEAWLARRARQGELPTPLFPRAERHLLDQRIGLPLGPRLWNVWCRAFAPPRTFAAIILLNCAPSRQFRAPSRHTDPEKAHNLND